MNRRSFFGMLSGLVASLSLSSSEEESYWYDWTFTEKETNDPKWEGKFLPRGKGSCKVYKDGILMEDRPFTRIQTGKNGWVEYAVDNPMYGKDPTAHRLLIDYENGRLVKEVVYGNIRWEVA